MQFPEICQRYIDYISTVKGRSRSTVVNYGHYLKRFCDFVGSLEVGMLSREIVDKYLDHIATLQLGIKTRNAHLTALREVLKYCHKYDILTLSYDKIELAKAPDKNIEYLTFEEFEKLASAITLQNIVTLRDRTIVELLFSSGLRVAELVNLNRKEINLETKQFSIIGKGNKSRLVFFSERTAYWLRKYLEFRNDKEEPLFVNYRHTSKGGSRRLSAVSIEKVVRTYAEKAGFIGRKITPHVLRHSFATLLLEQNVHIKDIQEMLGHNSILTTQGYLHSSNKRLKVIHQKAFTPS